MSITDRREPAGTSRDWRDHIRRRDVAIALGVAVVEVVGAYLVGQGQPDRRALDGVGVAVLVLGAAALLLRRRFPSAVLVGTNLITLLYVLLDYPKGPNFLAMIVALMSAILQGQRLIAWAVLAADFVAFPWMPYALGIETAPTTQALVGLAGWLLVWGFVAELLHIRRQRQLRAAEEEARRRAEAERLRIARELHDVLGHHLSLISVQSGVALHLMDQQPEQARVALAVIKGVSKDALRDLRSVLDVLRQGPEAPPLAPAPGLAHLSDLIARSAEAGLQVRTEVVGDLHSLPASIDLAAFRIVQEALTNVLRHSGATASSIQVTRRPAELTLRIENAIGPSGSRDGSGPGQGIRGMQERARTLGGVVEAGPEPDGRFLVVARLPLSGEPITSPGIEA